eukprot:2485839-Rhodomonas_salina.2
MARQRRAERASAGACGAAAGCRTSRSKRNGRGGGSERRRLALRRDAISTTHGAGSGKVEASHGWRGAERTLARGSGRHVMGRTCLDDAVARAVAGARAREVSVGRSEEQAQLLVPLVPVAARLLLPQDTRPCQRTRTPAAGGRRCLSDAPQLHNRARSAPARACERLCNKVCVAPMSAWGTTDRVTGAGAHRKDRACT